MGVISQALVVGIRKGRLPVHFLLEEFTLCLHYQILRTVPRTTEFFGSITVATGWAHISLFRVRGDAGAFPGQLAHPQGWVPRAPADPTEAPGPAQDEDALGSPSPCGGAAHAAPSGLRAGGAL